VQSCAGALGVHRFPLRDYWDGAVIKVGSTAGGVGIDEGAVS
jgi:hypothetical protein